MKQIRLKDIAISQTGPFGSQLHEEDYVDKGTPIVTVEHLGDVEFTTQNLPMVSDEDKERLNKYILREGDIVFSRVGSVDRSTYVKKEQEGWLFSGRCLRVRCDSELVNPRYLSFYFKLDQFKKMMLNLSVGATMPSLNTAIMDNILISLPTIDIQNKIAVFLDNIDEKVSNNNEIAQQLKAMAKTIYDYWFLQFEFPNEEGKPYKSSGGKMVWNEELQRDIPEGWNIEKLKDIIIENSKSKIKVGDVKNEGDIPFFTSGADILATSEPLVSGLNCYLNTGGNADVKYYYGDASYSTDTWCITAKDDMKYILPFILDKIKPSMDKVFFQGTGLRHLQKNLLREYSICIPNNDVTKKFEKIARDIFEQQHNLLAENRKLESLKEFLLPLLMNGQVTVGE